MKKSKNFVIEKRVILQNLKQLSNTVIESVIT